MFAILNSLIRVYTICHPQSDQGLHYVPFSAAWSGSTLFAIISSLIREISSVSTLFAIFSSLIRVYTLPFSDLSGSTLFAFCGSPIGVYTIFHSQQSYQGLHCFHFSANWSVSTLFPFSVWSGSTLFATLRNLMRICTICHSSLAVLLRPKLFAFVSSLIRFYTISWKSHQSDVCHSQQFDQGLHYLPSSVWSGSTLCAILSSLIWVYTFCQGLHCLPFSAVWSGSTLLAILSSVIRI